MGFGPRRCLGAPPNSCTAIIRFGSYCKPCRFRLYGSPMAKAKAAAIRAEARRCMECGEGERENDPWQADHLIPGDPMSPMRPLHRSCNIARNRVR